jgi:lipopolysaccharide cholinephosphotransferase
MDTKKLMRKIEKQLMKYPYDDCNYMISFFGAYMMKEIVDKKLIGDGKKYKFENLMLNGPDMYDEFLTHFYGDYMKPPSDAQKDKHNIIKIEYSDLIY